MSIKSDLPKIDVTVPLHPFDDFNVPKFYTWQFVTAIERAVFDHHFPSEDITTYLLLCENDRLMFRHGGLGEFIAFRANLAKRSIYPKIEYVSDRVVNPGSVILGNNQGVFAGIVGNWSLDDKGRDPAPVVVDGCIDVRTWYQLPNSRNLSNRYFFRYQLSVALSALMASGWNYDYMFIAVNNDFLGRTFGYRSGDMIGAYTPCPHSETLRAWESRVEFFGSASDNVVHAWNRETHSDVVILGDWSR